MLYSRPTRLKSTSKKTRLKARIVVLLAALLSLPLRDTLTSLLEGCDGPGVGDSDESRVDSGS
jgi:hypothetical protein